MSILNANLCWHSSHFRLLDASFCPIKINDSNQINLILIMETHSPKKKVNKKQMKIVATLSKRKVNKSGWIELWKKKLKRFFDRQKKKWKWSVYRKQEHACHLYILFRLINYIISDKFISRQQTYSTGGDTYTKYNHLPNALNSLFFFFISFFVCFSFDFFLFSFFYFSCLLRLASFK